MHIRIAIERSGWPTNRKATRKFEREAIKVGLQMALAEWHKRFLPLHFASPAAINARYPGAYAKRKKSYQRKKTAVKGHASLLKWSGDTERSVMQRPKLGGTQKRAHITLTFPSKRTGGQSGSYSSAPHRQIGKELTVVNASEDKALGRFMDSWLRRRAATLDRIKETMRT